MQNTKNIDEILQSGVLTTIVLIFIFAGLIAVLIFFLLSRKNNKNKSNLPVTQKDNKYKIASLFIIFSLSIFSIVSLNLILDTNTLPIVSALSAYTAQIDYKILSSKDKKVLVELSAILSSNNSSTMSIPYDINWTFIDSNGISSIYIEQNRGINNPSMINMELKKDKYKVKAVFIIGSLEITKTEEFDFSI